MQEACGNGECTTVCNEKMFYCPICLKAGKKVAFCSQKCFKKMWLMHKEEHHNNSNAAGFESTAATHHTRTTPPNQYLDNNEFVYEGEFTVLTEEDARRLDIRIRLVAGSGLVMMLEHGEGKITYKIEAKQTFTGSFRDGLPVKGTLITPGLYK
jgi:hypothetical protein